jgi:hypothetical protein
MKIFFTGLLLFFCFQLAFNNCDGQSNPIGKLQTLNSTRTNIMRSLYTNYDVKNNSSNWLCTNKTVLNKFYLKVNTSFSAKILYSDSVNSEGQKLLYVLVSNKPSDWIGSLPPLLEIIIFQKTSSSWNIIYRDIFDQMGFNGEPSPFTVEKIGDNTIGFLFTPIFIGQGITDGSMILYTFYKRAFKRILNIESSIEDNSGNCDPKKVNSCYGYTSNIQFVEQNKEFNPLNFVKTGTILENGKLKKINIHVVYEFVNGIYIQSTHS